MYCIISVKILALCDAGYNVRSVAMGTGGESFSTNFAYVSLPFLLLTLLAKNHPDDI